MRKLHLRKADHTWLSVSWALSRSPVSPPHNSRTLSREFQFRPVVASPRRQAPSTPSQAPGTRIPPSPLTDPGADLWLIRPQLKAQRPLCHCFNEKPITRSLVGGGDEEFGTGVGGRRVLLASGWFTAAVPGCLGKGAEPQEDEKVRAPQRSQDLLWEHSMLFYLILATNLMKQYYCISPFHR